MKFYKILLLGLLFTIMFNGCSSTDECIPTVIPTTSLEAEYGCLSTTATVDIDLDNTYVIIRNQDDYDTLVSGSCDVEIDFIFSFGSMALIITLFSRIT